MATITISSITLQNWVDRRTSVELWVFANQNFLGSDGVPVLSGNPNNPVVVKKVTCTNDTSAKTLAIPSFSLISTTDSLSNPNATYRAHFYTSQGAQIKPYEGYGGFRLNSSLATVNWSDIFAFNQQRILVRDDTTYTKMQIDSLLANQSGVPISRNVNTTAPLTGGGNLASDLTVAMAKATALVDGYLAAADFTTFNNKLSSNGNGSSLTNLNASALASGTVGDARLSGNVPLLNAAVNAFTGRLTSNVTPVFDLASGALSADFLISHASVSIGASKTFSAIRLGQSDGSSNTFTAGAGSVVSNIGSFARALSGSDATSNLYATVIQAENAGPGTVKSLHLLSSGVAGSTGALAAASFDVAPVTGQGPTFVIQVASSGVNNIARGLIFTTNGGNFDYGIDFVGYSTIPSYASAALRLSNNAVVAARAADNSANINLFKCNTSNEFEILTTALVLNQANPYIQVGSTAAGWLFQKVDSDNHWRMFKQGFGEVLALQGTNPSDGSTAMSLLVTKGGVTSLVQVGVGAADSGGTGKRALTVSN
jgi:hypothetical protein